MGVYRVQSRESCISTLEPMVADIQELRSVHLAYSAYCRDAAFIATQVCMIVGDTNTCSKCLDEGNHRWTR